MEAARPAALVLREGAAGAAQLDQQDDHRDREREEAHDREEDDHRDAVAVLHVVQPAAEGVVEVEALVVAQHRERRLPDDAVGERRVVARRQPRVRLGDERALRLGEADRLPVLHERDRVAADRRLVRRHLLRRDEELRLGAQLRAVAALRHAVEVVLEAELRARMRERLLGRHERRLVLHPSYNSVLNRLCQGTLDIEEALSALQGDNDERTS